MNFTWPGRLHVYRSGGAPGAVRQRCVTLWLLGFRLQLTIERGPVYSRGWEAAGGDEPAEEPKPKNANPPKQKDRQRGGRSSAVERPNEGNADSIPPARSNSQPEEP